MRRVLLPALGLAVVAALGTVTGGALSGHDAAAASVTAAHRAASPGSKAKVRSGGAFSIKLLITNNSSRTLHYVSSGLKPPAGQTISPDPAATIAPDGGTDTINLSSSNAAGADMTMTYRIDGTEKQLAGFFQVPTAGANEAGCTNYDKSPGCSIGTGNHPNANWVIRMTDTPPASLAPDGSQWIITKPGAIDPPQVLEVNKNFYDITGLQEVDTNHLPSGTTPDNEVWTYHSAGDTGWGQLVSKAYGGCLENDPANHSVKGADCTDGASDQLWKTVYGQSIGVSLQNKSDNSYLGVSEFWQKPDLARVPVQTYAAQSDLTDWMLTPASAPLGCTGR
jgi:hypothetical protein